MKKILFKNRVLFDLALILSSCVRMLDTPVTRSISVDPILSVLFGSGIFAWVLLFFHACAHLGLYC